MEAPVSRQLDEQFGLLRSVLSNGSATPADLAAGYGETGKLLMAANFLDAAEACYLNAQTLAPADPRWPYYLGHLYKGKGPVESAVSSFARALQLMPDDVPAAVWLGEADLAAGQNDVADDIFAKVLARDPSLAAAWSGAGRVALAKQDYQRAVDQLSRAIELDPHATKIHYSLAMAYRGLGDMASAKAHLAQQGDVDTTLADPLMRQIDVLLQSSEADNLRGAAELAAGNWEAAAAQFRKGLELAPDDPSLRHRLGTALYQMGDTAGAMAQFEQVLRTTPDYVHAHFSLGMLLGESGRDAEAIEHFSAALELDPSHVEARVELADTLARTGRAKEALDEYAQALTIDPTSTDAAFGRAMALVRLRQYAKARDRLSEGLEIHPDAPMFGHALARLLAAAPDDRVRDGRRALALVDELIKGQQSIELAETTAMALAEVGRYREAAAVQRDALTAATHAGLPVVERRIAGNLGLYESGRPCRTPFGDDELR
jgi:tetratricopeptide (TPR) repeat protein